jgi:hypothetical protein
MPVLAEGLRDQGRADQQEGREPRDENHGGANQMTRVTQKLAQGPSFSKGMPLSHQAKQGPNGPKVENYSNFACFVANYSKFNPTKMTKSG